MDYAWFIPFCVGIVALLFAGFLIRYVLAQNEGSDKIREISKAIQEGAIAFIGREYKALTVVMVIIAIILAILGKPVINAGLGWELAVALLFGAFCSASAGFLGLTMATRSNGRTAHAAQKSLNDGLRIAFRGGAIMGMCVVGIGVIGLSILYFVFHGYPAARFLQIIPAYGFGASGVAIFARVGGGIFTKAADTGADLVGKVEKGIPEDDPRNAAAIADFVGDNVGDVCGMGADLFESYVDSIIATITLGVIGVSVGLMAKESTAWLLPMLVAAIGIIASIIGCLLVRVGEKLEMEALLNALRRGTFSASILAAIGSALLVWILDVSWGVFWSIFVGLVAGVLIGESTNYFTSYAYSPTRKISKASQTGAGTNIVSGFSNGLMSTMPPVILVAIAIILAFKFANFYGVAIAGIGMLSTLGISLATDAYGPVADNSGGIVEMSGLGPEIRERTDALDSLGNTTAATGKGFAIGAAALTSLALMLSYAQAVGVRIIDLLDFRMIAGLFLGAMLPAIFCAQTMGAVGKTAFVIIEEVRRQFREIKGLMEGTARPEYNKCVDICTRAALKQMLGPGIMTILTPIVIGIILGPIGLGGFLAGAIASGFIFAITMANAGGSWDNAKKFIETGKLGGKGSDAHKAAVVGDTVGDPMKDTSGPSLNIMIKLMSIIALVIAPALLGFAGLIH